MRANHSGRRREAFDEVAELYDKARPGYPRQLVDDLLELSGIDKECRVLEIGPGSGQLTVPIAERGMSLIAVELGANLAGVARRKLATLPKSEVVVADFDEWAPPSDLFDLVVVATAFHWLDPATRVRKCADVLRPAAALAIIETHWGVGCSDDRFTIESQTCHARWDPYYDPAFRPPRLEDLPEENEELASSSFFDPTAHRRYLCAREYEASQYCDLLETFSNVRAFEKETRRSFLDCIANLIESRFEGKIVRHDVYDLWLARKPAVDALNIKFGLEDIKK